jgi:CBS domain-containing protein
VLEGSQYFRGKHKTMLANLMDLEAITVDDVMTPRNRIHTLDLAEKPRSLRQQLATSYHSRLPVHEARSRTLVGVLPLKAVVALMLGSGEITAEKLRPLLRPPYFIPAGTPLLTSSPSSRTTASALGLVVDEYGELLGLVTIEDIVEEIIGEFTTQAPGGQEIFRGSGRQRDRLRHGAASHAQPPAGTQFPLDGPENAQRPHSRASRRHSRGRHRLRPGGTNDGNPANPGSGDKSGETRAPVGRGTSPLQTQVERASSAG